MGIDVPLLNPIQVQPRSIFVLVQRLKPYAQLHPPTKESGTPHRHSVQLLSPTLSPMSLKDLNFSDTEIAVPCNDGLNVERECKAESLAREDSIEMPATPLQSPSAPSELPPYVSTCSPHTQPLEQKVKLKWREPCDSSFSSYTSSFTLGRGERKVIDSDNLLPVLEGRLYLASFEDMPDAASGIVYIRLNKKLRYIPFCADFGPFNLGTTHHVCKVLKNLLQVRIINCQYLPMFLRKCTHMRTHSHICACACVNICTLHTFTDTCMMCKCQQTVQKCITCLSAVSIADSSRVEDAASLPN